MILPEMHYEWLFVTKTIYDPEVFWVMVTALMTGLLVIGTFVLARMSYLPLVKAQRDEIATRKAVLVERFRDELLQPAAQKIFFLAAHGFLTFIIDKQAGGREIGYFTIIKLNENIMQQRLDQMFGEQKIVMTFEMDDEILAPLEEIAYYEEQGEIEFDDAYRIFGDYIDVCWLNQEIVKYIDWLRMTIKPGAYEKIEALQKRLKEHFRTLKAKGLAAI